MVHEDLVPTDEEVGKYMLAYLQHSCNVEYFLRSFELGKDDPERPHDLVGVHNKFEWNVLKGFAVQYREPPVDFMKYVFPSLELHRMQYHHKKWNGAGMSGALDLGPGATIDDMWVGSIDAVCSLLENRGYQGGEHSYDVIANLADANTLNNHLYQTVLPNFLLLCECS